jgi:hypothetical protein
MKFLLAPFLITTLAQVAHKQVTMTPTPTPVLETINRFHAKILLPKNPIHTH